jgi:hypothetical protein
MCPSSSGVQLPDTLIHLHLGMLATCCLLWWMGLLPSSWLTLPGAMQIVRAALSVAVLPITTPPSGLSHKGRAPRRRLPVWAGGGQAWRKCI